MRVRTSLVAVAYAALLGAAFPPAVGALDMTGTWEGKQNCKDYDGQKIIEHGVPATALISQSGDTMTMGVNNFDHYNGHAFTDSKNADKGETVFNACGTDDLPVSGVPTGEIVRAKVSTKPSTGKGSFSALSIFENTGALGTCKWSFKRTSTTDPNVPACP